MLKENKFKVIVPSVIILLPVLFEPIMWAALSDTMTTHWGADSSGAGTYAKAFSVFGLPFILLAVHFTGLFFASRDRKQKDQNKKAPGMIFLISPFLSLFISGVVCSAAFGKEFSFGMLTPAMLGIMFIFIGNYLPKIKQNRTLGIKISWTLNNEENWNNTQVRR